MVAEGAGEAGQTLTVARDMVARPGAVHALRTQLAAAVPVEAWRADCSRRSVTAQERESVDSGGWEQEAYL